jgi:hypothetical protein
MMGFASALAWELAKLAGFNHSFLAPVSVWAVRYLPMKGWSLGLLIIMAGFLSTASGIPLSESPWL